MTYCVGIEVDQGLVFAADTRTSGSFDDVRVYRKMHVEGDATLAAGCSPLVRSRSPAPQDRAARAA